MMQKRRGLSAVVGGIFMVLIMIGALNAYLYVTQEQGRVWSALTGESNANQNRLNEKIEITNVRVDGSRLNVTVTNTGGQVANVKSLYIVNETASTQYRYDISKIVDSRKSEVNIGQDSAITTIKSNTKYTVKVVTASGNSASAAITPVSGQKWPMSLFVIPATPTPNSNVTLLFSVTNNSTDSYLATGVTPELNPAPSCSAACTLLPQVTPSGNVQIAKGATALFKWIYKVNGNDGVVATFTATLVGAPNSVTEKATIKYAEVALSTTTVKDSTLAQKPEIFLTVPSPYGVNGDNLEKGAWGVSLVNPTSAPMNVSRIVITAVTPHGTSQKIFEKGAGCAINPVYPPSAAEWTCVSDNQLEWKDPNSPEQIPALSVKAFRAFVEPGNVGAATDEPAYIITATVFTSMGQFTKTGFSGSMTASTGPIFNVYLTSATNISTVLNEEKFEGTIQVTNNTVSTFRVAVNEFETSSSRYVKSNGTLIINVPEDFTEVTAASGQTGFNNATITAFTTGVHQIVVTTNGHLGDQSGAEGILFTFTAKAPVILDDTIYIMQILFDGKAVNADYTDFPATPFAQVPIHVVP